MAVPRSLLRGIVFLSVVSQTLEAKEASCRYRVYLLWAHLLDHAMCSRSLPNLWSFGGAVDVYVAFFFSFVWLGVFKAVLGEEDELQLALLKNELFDLCLVYIIAWIARNEEDSLFISYDGYLLFGNWSIGTSCSNWRNIHQLPRLFCLFYWSVMTSYRIFPVFCCFEKLSHTALC